MKVVYVSGPISAATGWGHEQNVRRAEEVALRLWKTRVVAPICPHTMGRYYAGEMDHEAWIAGDLAIIDRCDAILILTGWETSKGTLLEIEHAIENGLPIFYALDELVRWAQGGDLYKCWFGPREAFYARVPPTPYSPYGVDTIKMLSSPDFSVQHMTCSGCGRRGFGGGLVPVEEGPAFSRDAGPLFKMVPEGSVWMSSLCCPKSKVLVWYAKA